MTTLRPLAYGFVTYKYRVSSSALGKRPAKHDDYAKHPFDECGQTTLRFDMIRQMF